MTLAIVGLGQMGLPIAFNLAKGEVPLIVCNRSDRSFDAFRAQGIRTTTHPADLAAADTVFLCLPGTKEVQALLLGPDSFVRAGQTVVDLSTIDYTATLDLAQALAARGAAFMDAPISGMEARARDGTLTVMCGGDPDLFAAVRPHLQRIGTRILHMGPVGSGQMMKLINQLLFDINAAGLAEILPLAARLGLDPDLVGEVVNSGTGRSYASDFFIPRILQGRFTDGYPLAHAYKDLESGALLSARLGMPLPVLAAATATYQTALRKGLGAQDKGAMIRYLRI